MAKHVIDNALTEAEIDAILTTTPEKAYEGFPGYS